MIQEDYVSFEIAKLLKEKGFDKDVLITDWWYDAEGQAHKRGNYSYSGASFYDKETCFNCPTLQMAMKWLREVHNLHIQPEITAWPRKGYFFRIYSYRSHHVDFVPFVRFSDSYEEACEAAIKYALENLI